MPGVMPGELQGAARVGRYELLMQLASGGMATVFIGRQRGAGGFERLVAIKRMHPHIGADPEMAASFMDEARIASLIHHPNVVSVNDVHDEDGERLLVMDYVDGTSLAALMKEARKREMRLPRPVALRIVMEALRGLHAAHEQRSMTGEPLNVVHRDATPHNILLGIDGSVRLTDFGIAKAAERQAHTSAGQVKGKFRYMSPEQAMGTPLDRRVDIFAVGIILWELLSGRRFFQGSSDVEILRELAMGQFANLHETDPSVPTDLSNVVMRAITERPEDRWPTAEIFANAVESWARANAKNATPVEVTAVVTELCSTEILERRESLMQVLDGRRPPVNLNGNRTGQFTALNFSSLPQTGTDLGSYSGPSSIAVQSGPPSSDSRGAFQSTPPPPRPWWKHPAMLAVPFTGLVALSAAVMLIRTTPAPDPLPASASAPPTAPVERVTITMSSERPIESVQGPRVADTDIRDHGVNFSIPKSITPVMVHIRFKDGTEQEKSVTPAESGVIHLDSAAAPGSASATAPARATIPVGSALTGAVKVAPKLEAPRLDARTEGPKNPLRRDLNE
jgi:serine/threonine-protein kinase